MKLFLPPKLEPRIKMLFLGLFLTVIGASLLIYSANVLGTDEREKWTLFQNMGWLINLLIGTYSAGIGLQYLHFFETSKYSSD